MEPELRRKAPPAVLAECAVVATDLDRTFSRPDLSIDPAAVEAVRELQDAGVTCILATGRSAADVEAHRLHRLFDAYVLEGGAVWGRWGSLQQADATGVHDALRIVRHAGHPVRERKASFGTAPEALDLLNSLPGVAVHPNVDTLDVVPAGCDKGHALRDVLATLGLPGAKVAAIGDGCNDVHLLRAADLRYAVANADPLTKGFAHEVVGPCSEGFVELARRRLAARPAVAGVAKA